MTGKETDVYLDHAATTPVDPLVQQKMIEVLRDDFGNPSSVHAPGRRARRLLEEARDSVAAAMNAASKEIIFTSGATEADNLALRGLLAANTRSLITSPLEHSAVLATSKELQAAGRRVVYLEPDGDGEITPEAVASVLEPSALVALMLVNNETGVRTRIREISELVHRAGGTVFCDAVQAFGTEPLDVRELGVDALAISGHKAYGPKGVGVLWLREGVELRRITHGGEQERALRPGTHNTAAIAGMGVAADLARERSAARGEQARTLRDLFEAGIEGLQGVLVNGTRAQRGPKHSSVSVEDVDGEALLMSLDSAGVYASAGSACSAGSIEPSHVLTALGMSRHQAKATIRFSFGEAVGREAVTEAAELFISAVTRCRAVFA